MVRQKEQKIDILSGFNRYTASILFVIIVGCSILVNVFPEMALDKAGRQSTFGTIAYIGPILFLVLCLFKGIQKLYIHIKQKRRS